MIRAVLFDFDGTLLNTNELIFASYNHAFNEVLKRDITPDEIVDLYGKPLYSSLAKYGEAQEPIYKSYRKFNMENHDDMIKKFDGAAEGVRLLKEYGYRLAVVTSKRMHTLVRGIDFLGLDGYFSVIITPDETEKHKPEPEPVLAACEKLGVMPDEAVMVGDSIFDLESAKCAGVHLAAVKYSTTFDRLCEYNPEYKVDTILELAEILIAAGTF